jgi:hypothetical protein
MHTIVRTVKKVPATDISINTGRQTNLETDTGPMSPHGRLVQLEDEDVTSCLQNIHQSRSSLVSLNHQFVLPNRGHAPEQAEVRGPAPVLDQPHINVVAIFAPVVCHVNVLKGLRWPM